MQVQVIFYSMYGHIYRLAEAVCEGARQVEGAEVGLWQVEELVPQEALERTGAAQAREAFAHVPVARPEPDAVEADALIFGTPTPLRHDVRPDAQFPGTEPANSGPREP